MDHISSAILAIRASAGNPCDTCPTCTRARHAPYRYVKDGRIWYGCVDACHTGYLYGESLAWHTRQEARAIRANTLRKLRSL